MQAYPYQYTWSHTLGDHIIAHTDGAVSLMIDWAGIDVALKTEQEKDALWTPYYQLLQGLPQAYCIEFHLWREKDSQPAERYLALNEKITRGQAFAQPIREHMAEHLKHYGRSNRVALIITRLPPKIGWLKTAKGQLKRQLNDADQLFDVAQQLQRQLPQSTLASVHDYYQRITQSVSHEANKNVNIETNIAVNIDPLLMLNEQLIQHKPVLEQHQLKIKNTYTHTYTKGLYVFLYPDASPGWALNLCQIPCDLHISQIIIPVDTKSAMRRSERQTDRAEGLISARGRDYAAKNIQDLHGFRAFVAEHNLNIYKNAYVIHLHDHDPEQLTHNARHIIDLIEQQGGQVRDEDTIQLPFYRYAMPGQGYRCVLLRQDHTLQVANLLPIHCFHAGDSEPESLRLSASSQLVGLNISKQTIPHGLTVAMTGAGKGIEKVTTIAETYPLGLDWYIAEIGGSYQWVVEAFGGHYSHADTDTVINPLPTYDLINHQPEQMPLDTQLASSTIQALAFLLTDGQIGLDVHSNAAAQMVLQMLYAVPLHKKAASITAPTLEDFYNELAKATYFENDEQATAAKIMKANLHSFLMTSEGQMFTRQDNLTLSKGICGVDLKAIHQVSEKLLKFYLVFLSLRFGHLAFYAGRNPARILLDEMHVFVKAAPDVIGPLCSAITRMGRKDNAALDLVTQGITEIDAIENEVINSMPNRTLLYRSDEWDAIAERINMPAGALQTWRQYPYFEGLDYRPAMRSVGDQYYDLYLTFPDLLLDLGATSPADLDLKERIGKHTTDPLERLRLFRQEKEIQHAA